jgi:hypothetical protein
MPKKKYQKAGGNMRWERGQNMRNICANMRKICAAHISLPLRREGDLLKGFIRGCCQIHLNWGGEKYSHTPGLFFLNEWHPLVVFCNLQPHQSKPEPNRNNRICCCIATEVKTCSMPPHVTWPCNICPYDTTGRLLNVNLMKKLTILFF